MPGREIYTLLADTFGIGLAVGAGIVVALLGLLRVIRRSVLSDPPRRDPPPTITPDPWAESARRLRTDDAEQGQDPDEDRDEDRKDQP